jgi:hypothetical protein
MPALTESRKASILEAVNLMRQSWGSLSDTTTAATATGDAPMLFQQSARLAAWLEEVLLEHAVTVPDPTFFQAIGQKFRGILGRNKA